MRRLSCAATLAAAVLPSLSVAQQRSLPAERRHVDVTPQGAFFVRDHGRAAPSPGGPENVSPGLVWTRSDGGLAWIASAVSIGDRAGQVFAEYDLNNESAEVLSSFDSNPPTPVWTDNSPLGTEVRYVHSADAVNTHVAIDQLVLNGNNATRQARLSKYTSSSSTPDWTYTFAPVINAGANVGISRDGNKIVAAIYDDPLNQVEIAVFAPGSNVPLSYTVVPVAVNDYMRGFDLSADGSTLYFSAGITAYIFDIASASVVFSTYIGASFDSHAISGDGSVFAYGNFNSMSVFEKSGGTYFNTDTKVQGGACYCAIIDISDDGSTIAYGWTFYDYYLTVQVNAMDVATKAITMTNTATGSGGFQNIVSDVSISADGSRFAVGLWGDQGGLVPEVRVFSRGSNTPIASLDLPGSVFDLEISANGEKVVAGSKAVHANTLGNGGRVDLFDTGGEDFALRGAPHAGATVNFDTYSTPGRRTYVLKALGEDHPPTTFPGVGTLYIDRATLKFLPWVLTPASGIATRSFTVPSGPGVVGSSLWFQGFSVGPRQLTNDWIKMTILP
jgi:hypothetical protein